MAGLLSSLLRGKTARLVDKKGLKLIKWKQGCVLGIAGDKQQFYHECIYSLVDNEESKLPFFIQDGIEPPDVIEFDWKLQVFLKAYMASALRMSSGVFA